MINRIKKFFNEKKGLEGVQTPQNKEIKFILSYGNLHIGYLTLKNGIWYFNYSEDFKHQEDILPLADFPDKNQVYKSYELWPFFASRIPSINTSSVEKIITDEKINKHNIVDLLKRFGKQTITNPFILMPEAS